MTPAEGRQPSLGSISDVTRPESSVFGGSVQGSVNFDAAVVDQVEVAVVVTGLDRRLLYANPCAEALFGWPAGGMVGTMVGSAVGVDLDAATAEEIRSSLARRQPWKGEFTVRHPGGDLLTVKASNSGLFGQDGQLAGVVSVVTEIPEERRAVENLTRQTEGLRFLLEATTVLSSASDYRDCLRGLAALAVPMLGDLCLIDVRSESSIDRVAVRHANPAQQALADELAADYPPDPAGPHPAALAMRTGQSTIGAEMSDGFLRATTKDDRHYQLIKQLQFASYMCAPLKARGRVLGALTVVSSGSGRHFEPDDLALAEELAQRAALVIDNLRLLSERSRIARSLQAALLPPRLPLVPGLDLAARYLPAGEGSEVGGDFYDIFDLGRGAWVAAVGDVCGTGPDAAAVTGLVRHSLQASARQTRDPAAMLSVANSVLSENQLEDAGRFCTALCAVIRPGPLVRVTLAAAGHPPPLVVHPDGTIEEIRCKGALLGVGVQVVGENRRWRLHPGDRMVFYTDGLIEARDARRRFFGEGPLAECLAAGADYGPDKLAQHIVEAVQGFSADGLHDDLALLVIGVPQG